MQITSHVHEIRIPFELEMAPGRRVERFVNVFLVCGERMLLVDTGVAGAARIIADEIRSLGRAPSDLALTFLSHAHPDHIGGAQGIRRMAPCPVAAHAAERAWIEDTERQYAQRPIPGFQDLVEGPVPVDRLIEDGAQLDLGQGVTLEAIHLPGHAPGHMGFYCPADGILFTGDGLPLPGSLPIYEDLAASWHSVGRIRQVPNVQALVSSWDAPRRGEAIGQALEGARGYLAGLHRMVWEEHDRAPSCAPLELTTRVLARLGLPPVLAHPVVARSLAAHLAGGRDFEFNG